jgi:hypothetical protein
MEAVEDWSKIPQIRAQHEEIMLPGHPSMPDNRSISYQVPEKAVMRASAAAGIGSWTVSRGADERRQKMMYGNLRQA